MTNFPTFLKPNSSEHFDLPISGIAELPKSTVRFKKWDGAVPNNTYNNKPLLNWRGECVFAELAILREFESSGWDGRWIDTYGEKSRIGYWGNGVIKAIPADRQGLLEAICNVAKSRNGCFDVFCWNDRNVCFAEAKQLGKDAIRESQKNWLDAAIQVGLLPKQFLIVEWIAV